ncbi:DUF1810 domain-containing protein [Shimia sp. CNT1-13L.2]|uniref:DUF1810 domain-containing protein n=1 Tax=Shimia sp. CNT1-13L.2 TaxID=2959663 RepID=UPI0020CF9BD2|nr:DUF1810 domain-containing protein [Shimia sp. CNT1-13L.2]
MIDIQDLDRFLPRQEATHAQALVELTAGRKVTHWIWWEMPQLRSLGRSQWAHDYGLADLDEASRYLAHSILGPRLIEMFEALTRHFDSTAEEILGPVDALKVRSTATLFAAVPGAPAIFGEALSTFYDGEPCPLTLKEISL